VHQTCHLDLCDKGKASSYFAFCRPPRTSSAAKWTWVLINPRRLVPSGDHIEPQSRISQTALNSLAAPAKKAKKTKNNLVDVDVDGDDDTSLPQP